MPLKSGRRTDKEALFIGHLAATGDEKFAAMRAGYSDPTVQGWQKAHNPAIVEAVRKAQIARLNNDLLPKSLDLLETVLTDPKETTRNRITAAQTVLKYSLGGRDGDDAKEPHEMTPQELQARIDQLRRTLADKARPVIEHEPEGPKGNVFG
jgi:phage terminase small subunit